MKKLILFMLILLVTINSVCQQDFQGFIKKAITNLDGKIIKLIHNANLLKNNEQDFIEKAITDLDDEKIIKLIHNANLLKNNKEKYLEKLNNLLSENKFNKKTSFYKNKRCLKSLIFLGMGAISVKPITFSVQNNDIKSGLIWGAISSFLSIQGVLDLYKGLTNYDNKINYYRALAIREIFLKI